MSRTKRGRKGPGHDLWSRRPCAGEPATAENKKLTARRERTEERRILHVKKRQSTGGE